MKILASLVLAVILVGAGYLVAEKLRRQPDPVNAILTQMKTRAVIHHERWVSVWYRACPKVTGRDPKMLITWAAQLNYELPLSDLKIDFEPAANGAGRLKVAAPAIEAMEPTVPSDWVDALSTRSLFTLDESALVDAEKGRASPIARYLSQLYLREDASKSVEVEVRKALADLLTDLAGVLGLRVSSVEITIAGPEGPATTMFPSVPLCAGTAPAVNGTPLRIAQQTGVLQSAESVLSSTGKFPPIGEAREFFSSGAAGLELPKLEPSLGSVYGSVELEYPPLIVERH